jgi:hypothetical protein
MTKKIKRRCEFFLLSLSSEKTAEKSSQTLPYGFAKIVCSLFQKKIRAVLIPIGKTPAKPQSRLSRLRRPDCLLLEEYYDAFQSVFNKDVPSFTLIRQKSVL